MTRQRVLARCSVSFVLAVASWLSVGARTAQGAAMAFSFMQSHDHMRVGTYSFSVLSTHMSSHVPGEYATSRIFTDEHSSIGQGGWQTSPKYTSFQQVRDYVHAHNGWTVIFDEGLPTESIYQWHVNLEAFDAMVMPAFSIVSPTPGQTIYPDHTMRWTQPVSLDNVVSQWVGRNYAADTQLPIGTTAWTPNPPGLHDGGISGWVVYYVDTTGLVSPLTHVSGRTMNLSMNVYARSVESVDMNVVVPEPTACVPLVALVAGLGLRRRAGGRDRNPASHGESARS